MDKHNEVDGRSENATGGGGAGAFNISIGGTFYYNQNGGGTDSPAIWLLKDQTSFAGNNAIGLYYQQAYTSGQIGLGATVGDANPRGLYGNIGLFPANYDPFMSGVHLIGGMGLAKVDAVGATFAGGGTEQATVGSIGSQTIHVADFAFDAGDKLTFTLTWRNAEGFTAFKNGTLEAGSDQYAMGTTYRSVGGTGFTVTYTVYDSTTGAAGATAISGNIPPAATYSKWGITPGVANAFVPVAEQLMIATVEWEAVTAATLRVGNFWVNSR